MLLFPLPQPRHPSEIPNPRKSFQGEVSPLWDSPSGSRRRIQDSKTCFDELFALCGTNQQCAEEKTEKQPNRSAAIPTAARGCLVVEGESGKGAHFLWN